MENNNNAPDQATNNIDTNNIAPEQPTIDATNSPRLTKRKKLLLAAIVALCVIGVGAGVGYYFYQSDSGSNDTPVAKTYEDDSLYASYPEAWTANKFTPTIKTNNKIYKFQSNIDTNIKDASEVAPIDPVLSTSVTIKGKSKTPRVCENCEVLSTEDITISSKKYKLIIVDTNNNKRPDYIGVAEYQTKTGDKEFNLSVGVSETKEITVNSVILGKSNTDNLYSLVHEAADTQSLKQAKPYMELVAVLNTLEIK